MDHPSLAVLLNMMGSVQVKRGEYGEAMKIYELSLKGRPDENGGKGRKKNEFRNNNPLTTRYVLMCVVSGCTEIHVMLTSSSLYTQCDTP